MNDTVIGNIGDLSLQLGGKLPDAKLAYATRGKLAADGRNAVLLTHGYTSSHLFFAGAASAEGSWATLVGPGLAIDTDRYFVVSSNMIGSSYGSTAPMSFNPATGRAYGPDFPQITVTDIVAAATARQLRRPRSRGRRRPVLRWISGFYLGCRISRFHARHRAGGIGAVADFAHGHERR